jgi:hypothetical protein
MVIRVRTDGSFITYRFNAWRTTSQRTLESDLKVGCYNDGNASRVTSVTIEPSKSAPAVRLTVLYDVLAQSGWPKDRVQVR